MMSDTDRAWAAGIFEGEGSVRINAHTHRNRGHLIATVTSTDYEMVEWFRERYGGWLKQVSTRVECKPAWAWGVAALKAAHFLRDILDYCRVPRVVEKIHLGLWFQDQKSMSPKVNRTEEYRWWQEAFFDRMAELNRRGAMVEA